jgi:hypothetical protein
MIYLLVTENIHLNFIVGASFILKVKLNRKKVIFGDTEQPWFSKMS